MKTGKISRAELEKYVLKNIARRRDETILGVGADCAAIKTDKLVFLSVDPITSAKKDIGALSVYIACNDLCAGGAEPLAVMLTVLLPPDTGADVLNGIMASAERA
ncbi:MAG: AIR synthase related protein, partial [Firmicutes bacterium]|nr:AIR synthase related protein [Bacillota bacterium]